MSARAASSIAPHSGVGGWAPRPRNDRLEAVMLDVPMRNEEYTMTAEIVPGKMWRITIVKPDAPRLRAASMYVRCFSASVLPRTRRAKVGTLKIATAAITFDM